MKLTIVGSSGSYPGPESAASCYLVQAPFEGRTYSLLLDLGSGALGPLQDHLDLRDVDAIALSHLHPDHCFDMSGLYVVRKYHPAGALPKIPTYAPAGADWHLSNAYGTTEPNGMTWTFDFREVSDGLEATLGPFTVRWARVIHPVPAYAISVSTAEGTLVYSGDTGWCESLVDFARGADLFLCEASFLDSPENPPDLHLSGAEAGRLATSAEVRRLLVTHIPPWTERDAVAREVAREWSGPTDLVRPGDSFTL